MIACACGGIIEVTVALLIAGGACVCTKVYNIVRGRNVKDNHQR